MSAVDVLGAMRKGEAYCYDAGASDAARALKEARAAVAELTAAARNLPDYLEGYLAWQRHQGDDPVGLDIAETDIERFLAALARVGGAS